MSTKPTPHWISTVFHESSVMLLAVMLASLPFAAAQAQTAQNPGTPVWSMLAKADQGTDHGALYAFSSSSHARG